MTLSEAKQVLKLSVADIKSMRGKMTSGQLAKKYGIAQSYVFTIWAGRCWK